MNGQALRDKRGQRLSGCWSGAQTRATIRAMGTEIERKFLVKNESWRSGIAESHRLRQGYFALDGKNSVRIRTDDRKAWLTLKGPADGLIRPEFEYETPSNDAEVLLRLCGSRLIEKIRHLVPCGNNVWEIDEFFGANAGLVVAELELASSEEEFVRPEWLGDEVSGDARYLNANLSIRPFGAWDRPHL